LQLILDAKPDTVTAILARQPPLAELCNNAWVQLIAVDPESGATWVYRQGSHFVAWQPEGVGAEQGPSAVPQVASSREGYYGQRHHLPPVLIQAPDTGATATSEGLRS